MSKEELKNHYLEKVKGIEAEKDTLKLELYLQSKMEAHLELLSMLGLFDILEQTKKRK